MTADATLPADQSRAAARRAQILDAAAQCFRAHGFHGASIARISQLAGMSTGHIYHYFENKEAIIAAIVERDLEQLLMISAEMRASSDIIEAMIECVAVGVIDNLDADTAALKLEIVAEAARNPEVSRVVHAADCCCVASLVETLRIARRAGGQHDDDAQLTAMTEVLGAIFDGLAIRAIRNPDLDRQQVVAMVEHVVRSVIADPHWGTEERLREAAPQAV
ncbi:TetR family transcriptional regulator [Betaproteobacteria bacterium]|nr:TetR family transcriptional regulator [Betaproteobacteria bacterium]GHU01252.1 TetR family transcriptional regulator [Betaproteobacteria bacterium]GHU12396.1 TetR family transcriptional regulator [Betaproteobacteria bacterium]GHU17211.1 TetR family transcriptional regulator [Betaproteobacteria bacterium]